MLLLFLKSGEKTRSEAADDELNKLWQAIIARQTSVEVHLPPFKWTKSVSAALARYVGNLAFPPPPPPPLFSNYADYAGLFLLGPRHIVRTFIKFNWYRSAS